MKRIGTNKVVFSMSKENNPVLECESGEIVTFTTLDCFSNTLLNPSSILGKSNPSESNPATGPLFIKGATPGDVLKIEVLNIKVGNLGVNLIGPVNPAYQSKISKFKVNRIAVKDNYAIISETIRLPIKPMIGVIGVAPRENSISTSAVGKYGGNMDCSMIRKGAIVFLPVFTQGALLSIGDLHALMGDGEIGENGLEIEGEVQLRISVLKGKHLVSPVINIERKWAVIESRDSVEEASNAAAKSMLDLLINNMEMKPDLAMTLINLVGNIKVCQLCGPKKTVLMELAIDQAML